MSNSISTLSSKFFLLFSTLTFLVMCAALIHLYSVNIEELEKKGFQEVNSIGRTFSTQLDASLLHDLTAGNPDTHFKNVELLKSQLNSAKVANDNEINLSLYYYNKADGTYILAASSNKTEASSLPLKEFGEVNSENQNKVISTLIPALETKGKASVFLKVEKNLNGYYTEYQAKMIKQGIWVILVFALIIFVFKLSLQRILKQERKTKLQMENYFREIETKNKQYEKLSLVISKSENLILLTDSHGNIEWLNQTYDHRNNFTKDELTTFKGRQIAEVSNYPKIGKVIEKVIESGKPVTYEVNSFDKRQKEYWTSTSVTPVFNDDKKIVNLLFIDTDITKLKSAEREIAKLASFPNESTKPVFRISFDGVVQYINNSAEIFLELWETEIGGKVKREGVLNSLRKAQKTNKEQELTIECQGRIWNLQFYPIIKEGYSNIYGNDITELKLAEQASREKLDQLERSNLDITDSINYAKRIQESIMPSEDQIRKYFKDAFVMLKPKDIVSGDFLFTYEIEEKKQYLVASIDCTGHGVPGAMMSLIAHSLLNEIVDIRKIHDPAQILRELNREVIKALRQKTNSTSSEGLDISLCLINKAKNTVVFSGAYRPIYWVNGKMNILKGDRYPIGGLHHDVDRKFTNHTFKVSQGDSIYLFSDGFADQFGGPENKKFLSHRLVDIIEKNHKYSMQAQSYMFHQIFENWKGDEEQIDDVSLVGIKF